MRKYNVREKKFLKLLTEISKSDLEFFSFFMQKKYFTKDNHTALIIIPQKAKALLYVKKNIFDDLSLRKQELKKFIEVLSLIEYLKQARLIDIIPNPQAQTMGMHIMHENFDSPYQATPSLNIILNQDKSYLKLTDLKVYNINDEVIFEAVELEKHTYDIIMNNLMGLLFVSEDLNEFVIRGFRSVEDIRYKYAQVATWVSIFIALIFGILGLYKPFNSNKVKEVGVNNKQFNILIENTNDLKKDIGDILEILKENTTPDSIPADEHL